MFRILGLLFLCFFRNGQSGTVITVRNDFGLEPVDVNIADTLNWYEHPCRRNCKDESIPRDCYYTFKLESYQTMSKACYDCPFNVTDCFRTHCIPADGVKRSIMVVNRQMPGPAIEVCQGDRIIVDMINLLHSESTTMHWHGQHHVKTPYMDGVPYISQCPILPGTSFRYDFIATEAGTHFWHSHLGFQRGDGVFGPLIVRVPPKKDFHRDLYDVDEHTLLVLDWSHQTGIDKFLAHHHSDGDNKGVNILINGMGNYETMRNPDNATAEMPYVTYTVKQSLRYRFRLINAGFLNCPIEVSVDNHTMVIVSSDGRDLEPVEAESLVTYAGERFDFIVEMNQEIGNYWIRYRGLMDCDERFFSAHQFSILRYEGAPEEIPDAEVTYERTPHEPFVQVNTLNKGTEYNESVSIPMLNSMDEDDESNTREPDYQFYISYDFYGKDNPHFHRKDLYGFYQVDNMRKRLFTPQFNNISMKMPSFPLFTQRELVNTSQFCNSSTVKNCKEEYCSCTHVLQVKTNSVVELVLVDEGVTYYANHPLHIHGYQFRVVAMERLGNNTTVDTVKQRDADGLIKRKLKKAPLKDTVTVPDGGFTIVRFHADNPGYWFFHCHIEFHAEVGMSLIFKVGDHEEMQKVPKNFPRCGNFDASKVRQEESISETTRFPMVQKPRENEISTNAIEQILKLFPLLMKELNVPSSASSPVSFAHLILCLLASYWYRNYT